MGNSMAKLLILDFGIQLAGFIPSALLKTEKFYDFAGSLTFILLSRLSLWNSQKTLRQRVQTNLVTAWAVRLGLFLLYRVLHEGGDRRFQKVKQDPAKLFMFWMIQGVWVFFTLFPTLCNNEDKREIRPTLRDYVGWGMWGVGFLVEAIADYQKFTFRANPDNAEKFINTGLWSISRHPNYFGEILLWLGLFISSTPSLKGWRWVSCLSPLFVYGLLTRVSGIPILERSGLRRYGHLAAYQEYLKSVPELIPFFGKS